MKNNQYKFTRHVHYVRHFISWYILIEIAEVIQQFKSDVRPFFLMFFLKDLIHTLFYKNHTFFPEPRNF